MANKRELLALVYFLKRFRCYVEGSPFEVFTDNQVLLHFFSKSNMNQKETRWLDLLSQFGHFAHESETRTSARVMGGVVSCPTRHTGIRSLREQHARILSRSRLPI